MLDLGDEGSTFRSIPIPQLARGGRWRVEAMRSYSHARLIWFTRGQGRITVAGVTRGYGPNNVIFLPAGTIHGFELNAQVFGTIVDFPANYTGEIPNHALHVRARENSNQVEFAAIFESFQRELSQEKLRTQSALESYANLMMIWLDRQAEIGAVDVFRQSATRKLATRYANAVEAGFASGKTIGDFAQELGVTPTHLNRVCSAASGKSAHEFLNDRLLAEARKLLADTNLPIRDIAAELGFSSAAYFTRAFQKKTGKTPSHFRSVEIH